MEIKKQKNTVAVENRPQGKRKRKQIGRHKTVLIILWAVFILAFVWSIYKNFTALDTHTVHETEVVKEVVVDTSGIKSFADNFIEVYYNYDCTSSDNLSNRQENLKKYLSDAVYQLESNLITAENKSKSNLLSSDIWAVENKENDYYKISYSVSQGVTRNEITQTQQKVTAKIAGEEVRQTVQTPVNSEDYAIVNSSYYIVLYVDDSGNMVITQCPTITSTPTKSTTYSSTVINTDNSVSADEKKEITDFLSTFFANYPTADNITLSYYVDNSALPVISADYQFVNLKSVALRKTDNVFKAYVVVDYLYPSTNTHTYSQYCLDLEKRDKWIITGSELYV